MIMNTAVGEFIRSKIGKNKNKLDKEAGSDAEVAEESEREAE